MTGTPNPTTLTVIKGIADGTAFRISPVITEAIKDMRNYANQALLVQNPSSHYINPHTNLLIVATNLENQSNRIFSGLYTEFSQTLSHISVCKTIKSTTDFMSKFDYKDLGSNIGNISTLSDQGLTSSLGNLTVASEILTNAGKVYSVSDMTTFGSPGGLVQSLITNKLANYSGLTDKLTTLKVDMNRLNDSAYDPQIIQALASITDTTILDTITKHYKLESGSITSLADLLNIEYYSKNYSNLIGGFSNLRKKMSDLGLSFKTSQDAVKMLANIKLPNVAMFSDMSSSMGNLQSNIQSSLTSVMGTGTGVGNLPTMYNFTSTITANSFISTFSTNVVTTGTSYIDPFDANVTQLVVGSTDGMFVGMVANTGFDFGKITTIYTGNNTVIMDSANTVPLNDTTIRFNREITQSMIDTLTDQLIYVNDLYTKADINLAVPAHPAKLSAIYLFANALETYATDDTNRTILTNLANTSNACGQAVITALTNGKNSAAMTSNGGSAIKFS